VSVYLAVLKLRPLIFVSSLHVRWTDGVTAFCATPLLNPYNTIQYNNTKLIIVSEMTLSLRGHYTGEENVTRNSAERSES